MYLKDTNNVIDGSYLKFMYSQIPCLPVYPALDIFPMFWIDNLTLLFDQSKAFIKR